MDYELIGMVLVAVVFIAGYIYESWRKKQGYDQGDEGFNISFAVCNLIATLIMPIKPELGNAIISIINKITNGWNDPTVTTGELKVSVDELNAKIEEAKDVLINSGIDVNSGISEKEE